MPFCRLQSQYVRVHHRQRSSKTNSFITNLSETPSMPLPTFLAYVAESIAENQSIHARTALLLNVFSTSTYLATKDIHSLTSTFDTDTCKTVLSAYCLAVATLKVREIDTSIPMHESALLTAALSKTRQAKVPPLLCQCNSCRICQWAELSSYLITDMDGPLSSLWQGQNNATFN